MFTRQLRRLFSQAHFNKIKITDPWKVLGVTKESSKKDIKKAYVQMVKEWHPDKGKDNGEKFKQIQEAYSILSDPEEFKRFK